MNKRKEQLVDDETKKLQRTSSLLVTVINTDKYPVTSFEHISNETIYEIFGYLDGYHIYESFFNLNIRFQNLLTCSTIPIKINISSLSKSTFQMYYTRFILPNKHQIKSLNLPNPFIIDFFSSSIESISKCSQLQTLILDDLESQTLENLINHLVFLPNLSSLVIHISHDSNKINIYSQIFQLPLLKYCKISYEENIQLGQLPICTNTSSPIEHLVIHGKCYLTELDALLSYVPQLRYLSVKYINAIYNPIMENYSFILNKLTFVSLKLDCVKFDNFEQFVKNHFGQVKVFYISTTRDMTYLEADRWEQLILSHMPCLQIFDFEHTIKNFFDYPEDVFVTLFDHFNSQFWHQRQWFFTYQSNSGEYQDGIFHSTQPYRRKYFSLVYKSDSNKIICDEKTVLPSVHHVIIQDDQTITNCSKYFPNVTQLTLSDHCSLHSKWFSTDDFHRIIPLTHLNKITINSINLNLRDIVNMLFYTPNIHTLTFKSIKLIPRDYLPLQGSEVFRLISNQNKIKNIIFTNDYSLKTIKLLINLCPGLQRLTIGISRLSLEPTIQFLLSEINETTCHLSLLCILGMNIIWIEKLKTLVESKKLLNDYSIKIIDNKFYLWW